MVGVKVFNNLSFRNKLGLIFLLIGTVSILLSGYLGYINEYIILEENAFHTLTTVKELKGDQIEAYIRQIENQLISYSEDRMIVDALREFKSGFQTFTGDLNLSEGEIKQREGKLRKYYKDKFLPQLNRNLKKRGSISNYWPQNSNSRILQDLYISSNKNDVDAKDQLETANDGSYYSNTHRRYHRTLHNYLKRFSLADIFLIDSESGRIVYSVSKKTDYTTSLLNGPYSKTNLANAFRTANALEQGKVKIVDFELYHPSYGNAEAFLASPVFDEGKRIGVIVFQIPTTEINRIMTNAYRWSEIGLGKTEETYLVGKDFTMRSQSRFLVEVPEDYFKVLDESALPKNVVQQIKDTKSSVGLHIVKTEATKEALSGNSGEKIIKNYRHVNVLSSYKALNIKGVKWVIVSEIDQDEAFAPLITLRNHLLSGGAVLLFFVMLLGMVLAAMIVRPLKKTLEFAKILGEGNFSKQLDIERTDEIGSLITALNQTSQNLSLMVGEMDTKINNFAQATTDLDDLSHEMNSSADDSVTKANTVATATEEMTANMQAIASAMEESTTNVNAVAAATEEMSTNINDISQRSGIATTTVKEVVEQAVNSVKMISELGQASQEIGTVTEIIASISDKTNLLALNATIEAARAGEAGKGFAVVANEIKSLAHQTAEATTDITSKLKLIQNSTTSSVEDITEIEKRIREVDEIVAAISESMKQQDSATAEITENVAQTSQGLREINENAAQTSQAAEQIAMEIAEVNEAATGISNSSAMVSQTSGDISNMVSEMEHQLSKFTVLRSKFKAGSIKIAHAAWRRKLSDLVADRIKLDPSDISDHYSCEFGKWIVAEGREKFISLAIFGKIEKQHELVHETAKKVAQLYKDGLKDEARKLLLEFKKITVVLFRLLDELEAESAKME